MSEHHVNLSLVGNRVIAVSEPIPEELRASYERVAELEAMLGECRDYFEARSDVIDGSYGEPAPNREMKLLIEIDQVLA